MQYVLRFTWYTDGFFLRGLNSPRYHIPTLLYVYITMQVGSCGTESFKGKKKIAKLFIGPEYKQNRTPYHDHHIQFDCKYIC